MSHVKRIVFLVLFAAAAFSVLFALTADAQADPEANQPEYWCEEGFKVEWDGDTTEYIADGDYLLVVIKAGTENYTFDNVKEGDVLTVPKGISHIIFCRGTVETTTTTEPPTTTTVPEETTTTVGETTTTVRDDDDDSSDDEEEPSTTTTTSGTTNTETVPPSSTSIPPTTEVTSTPTTNVPTTTPTNPPITELPFTGISQLLLPLSTILLASGGLLLRKTRESS